MTAILFGSIGTLADTSELQRDAFNRAFAEHGLDWSWSREEYTALLERSGGAQRIAAYAQSRGDEVDPAAIHATKSEIFQTSLATSRLQARPGVVEAIGEGRESGCKIALVTTTSPENVSALLQALSPEVSSSSFDVLVDASDVDTPKPDAAAYRFALDRLGEAGEDCVAIEDNLGGVDSAVATGLRCVAFPNANTAEHRFDEADSRVDRLRFSELRALIAGA